MNAFMVYLIFLMDKVNTVSAALIFICGAWIAGLLWLGLINIVEEGSYREVIIKFLKIFIIALIGSVFMWICVPRTQTLVAMYIVPRIINNRGLQQMPNYIIKYINTVLIKKTEKLKQTVVK